MSREPRVRESGSPVSEECCSLQVLYNYSVFWGVIKSATQGICLKSLRSRRKIIAQGGARQRGTLGPVQRQSKAHEVGDRRYLRNRLCRPFHGLVSGVTMNPGFRSALASLHPGLHSAARFAG
jgi:hypothetical protein